MTLAKARHQQGHVIELLGAGLEGNNALKDRVAQDLRRRFPRLGNRSR